MYCKLFASLYQGTLRGRTNELLVFTNLLAHCDQTGIVDKHFRAIAEEVGLTAEEVKESISNLESPDPESRSPEESGARIVKLDGHRAWGWRVVNYGKYRSIKNEEDRRVQNRLSQQRWRERHKPSSSDVITNKQRKPSSAQGEGEGEADGEEKKKTSSSAEEFMDAWNECPSPVPKIQRMSEGRRKALNVRMSDPFWSANWRQGLKILSETDFLVGKNDKGWIANPDWFLKPDPLIKILEGSYGDNKPVNGARVWFESPHPQYTPADNVRKAIEAGELDYLK